MAPARNAQFRLHQELGALPQIEESVGVLPLIGQFLGVLPQIEQLLGTLPRIEHHLGALPQIERDLAEIVNCLPRGSGEIEIEDDEDVKQACIFLCRAVRQYDLKLTDRHVWVKHFKKIRLSSLIEIAELTGTVSSVTDEIQQKIAASNILGAPSRAATRMIVVAARSAVSVACRYIGAYTLHCDANRASCTRTTPFSSGPGSMSLFPPLSSETVGYT